MAPPMAIMVRRPAPSARCRPDSRCTIRSKAALSIRDSFIRRASSCSRNDHPLDWPGMHSHRQNPGFGILCDAVAYRRLVVVTGSGVSVGLTQPGQEQASLPTWHSVLTQLQQRFAHRLGSAAAEVELLLGAQPRSSDYLIE